MRLFVALNLPESVRRAVWEATAPLRDRDLPVKWVGPEGIHLTLKFLGEVEDAREAEVGDALHRSATGGKTLPLALDGFGVFPDYHRPRVFWLGVAPEPGLELLQHGVEREFEPLGFPTEGRPFRPHITLGRAAREARARDFEGFEPALGALQFTETVLVESVDLMRSTLQRSGAVYQVIHRERLL